MHDSAKKSPRSPHKVLFIRLDEDIYQAVADLADEQERSINWMATKLLKTAIEQFSSKN